MAAVDGVSSDDKTPTDDTTTEAKNAETHVLVLGPVGLGRPFRAPSSNILRAVLAALALAGPGGLSAGELFETVWGSRDARSMDSTLTVNIHRLRQWLRTAAYGKVSVTRTTTGYALHLADGEVDADRFLRQVEAAETLETAAKAGALGEALSLWRGPALADVPDGSADQAAVMRLELRRVTAVVEYARALLGIGQAEQAVHALSPLVETYPLDERVIGAWIESLAATGRQADALDAYERLRLRLRDEIGADPGRALSQALTRVLRQEIAQPVAEDLDESPPAGRHTVLTPAQLPADTFAFTGRGAALARLEALTRDEETPGHHFRIATVTGAGGIGKTALAIHWARHASAFFPDGQLYANLHGFSATPPERPIDVLGRFLRALGVAGGSVPVDVEEAAALYRSLLVNRSVLIVLDNAADAAQVRPLLPGAETCRVLITSRDRLDGLVALDGAHPVGLDVLSERECVELLTRILGEARAAAEPETLLELVRACARLPLALRIAAAQLVIRPQRPIAELVGQLAAARLDALTLVGDESSQLRAVFDLSYVRLDPQARRLFRMLGAIPAVDLSAQSAAVLLECAAEEAERALGRLTAAHLLTVHLPTRYDCHDLLRDYAGELSRAEDPAAEREAAAHRLADWYEAGVTHAVEKVYPDRDRLPDRGPARVAAAAGEDTGDALDWLRVEHRNLLAVIAHAAEHGPHSNAWRMALELRPHFYAAELHGDWFAVVASARRALEREPGVLGDAAVHVMLGDVAQLRGQSAAAIEEYTHARAAAEQAGWTIGAAMASMRLGLGHFDVGELEAARACFERSLRWYRESGSKFGVARAIGNLGLVHCDTGPLRKAIELLKQYDESRAELGFARARAQSLCALGYAHWRAGEFAEARRLLDTALELAETSGETRSARLAHCDLVALHCALGDYARARYHATLAESLGAQAGTPRAMTQTAFAWGLIHEGERDYARALEHYDEVLRSALGHGDSDHELCALLGGASVRRMLGALKESLHQAQQALVLSHERGCRLFEAQALVELAETHLALGHLDRARQNAQRAVELAGEVGYRLALAKALRALGDILRHAEGEQAALPNWRAAHAVFAELGSPEARRLAVHGV
ncbi:tetratricopeptide repeat protein [Actinocrinis puniceicyclus]|uniref:Tetratricopeptide repeat protein n=1 Tax=Actinocrinis puniceicyclus TaxID=977794 RepID=A0A8J8BBJ1_9ACTN|nr:BTAD domain-containing putative transcriptional regulator [Actinocrinis puniceicyclus]MBS2963188.1 tetratricopeptide repeat protein [Actinocrinis puniceicyclus]